MKRTRTKSRAFTLMELLVVIAIIALLMSILAPSLSKAKKMAMKAVCSSNLHQWHIALSTYAADHKGNYPNVYSCVYPYSLNMSAALQIQNGATRTYSYFGNSIYPYIKDNELGRCPANKTWKAYPEWNLWAQDQNGNKDRDGTYQSQYCFFIDSPQPGTDQWEYIYADAHGYVRNRVPRYDGNRRGNLLLAQDLTYAKSVSMTAAYRGLSMFNHSEGIPTAQEFDQDPTGVMTGKFEGANSLYVQGNVEWTRGTNLTNYAVPGQSAYPEGVIGYLFFPEGGPGANEAR